MLHKFKVNPLNLRWLQLCSLLLAPGLFGAKGCGVATVGAECGGLAGVECARGEYCNFGPDAACGAADQTGICETVPKLCAEIYAPVCGCDDKTYGNECEAAGEGVSVARVGECEPAGSDPTICGGDGTAGGGCGINEFCKYAPDAGCGGADQTGVCETLPEACDLVYAPVCGCDGNTYENDCLAAAVAISVAAAGECELPGVPPQTCGGLLALACAEDEYCKYAPDAQCGAADQTGVCQAMPDACDAIYAPVCGCDGETYGNDCVAAAAGVSVVSEGECEPDGTDPQACGARLGDTCAEDEYCHFAPDALCGFADGTGVCESKPEVCDAVYAPVCGCDGETYSSECAAAEAGVSVQTDGECEPVGGDPGTCGGLLGTACAEGQYCKYAPDAECGAADQTGVCELLPEACDLNYSPVCGCDGDTYGNDCEAAMAGISVAAPGECVPAEPDPEVCGGLLGVECAAGEYCKYAPDAACGAGDQTGVCEPKPEVCPEIYAPACGCDGKTYSTNCDAAGAGVSVAAEGECASDDVPGACGGLQGLACDEGFFCSYDIEAACGAADALGTCTAIPDGCITLYDPVCGCDDKTYGNACDAAAASVSVAKPGACDPAE